MLKGLCCETAAVASVDCDGRFGCANGRMREDSILSCLVLSLPY